MKTTGLDNRQIYCGECGGGAVVAWRPPPERDLADRHGTQQGQVKRGRPVGHAHDQIQQQGNRFRFHVQPTHPDPVNGCEDMQQEEPPQTPTPPTWISPSPRLPHLDVFWSRQTCPSAQHLVMQARSLGQQTVATQALLHGQSAVTAHRSVATHAVGGLLAPLPTTQVAVEWPRSSGKRQHGVRRELQAAPSSTRVPHCRCGLQNPRSDASTQNVREDTPPVILSSGICESLGCAGSRVAGIAPGTKDQSRQSVLTRSTI